MGTHATLSTDEAGISIYHIYLFTKLLAVKWMSKVTKSFDLGVRTSMGQPKWNEQIDNVATAM